jgi:hypothetical protein
MVIGVYFVFLMIADFVLQIMKYAMEYLKSKIGKTDAATEYKYLTRVVNLNLFAIFVTLIVGALGLMGTEGWSFPKALYFAVETTSVETIIIVSSVTFFICLYC